MTEGLYQRTAVRLFSVAAAAFSRLIDIVVGVPGLEPRLTDPESAVIPLHYTPKVVAGSDGFEPPTRGPKIFQMRLNFHQKSLFLHTSALNQLS